MPDQPRDLREAGAAGTAPLTPAIARGDPEAMAAFYEAWFDRAYAMARSLTRRDEAFCLDVVQEAMLKVARKLRPMPTEDDVARWMKRVVHSAALDRLRQEGRRRTRESRAAEGAAATTSDELQDRIEWIRTQLASMPPEDAGLLRLRFWLGRSLAQAGSPTGMTGDAAHGRIRRILTRLRSLAKEGADERG